MVEIEVMYLLISLLLLTGMVHIKTVLRARERVERAAQAPCGVEASVRADLPLQAGRRVHRRKLDRSRAGAGCGACRSRRAPCGHRREPYLEGGLCLRGSSFEGTFRLCRSVVGHVSCSGRGDCHCTFAPCGRARTHSHSARLCIAPLARRSVGARARTLLGSWRSSQKSLKVSANTDRFYSLLVSRQSIPANLPTISVCCSYEDR